MSVKREDVHAPLGAGEEDFPESDLGDGLELEVPAAVLPPFAQIIQDEQKACDDFSGNDLSGMDAKVSVQLKPSPPGGRDAIQAELPDEAVESAITVYMNRMIDIEIFSTGVQTYLTGHPDLKINGQSIVHSSKARMKDPNHLREKIRRKHADGKIITSANLFEEVTDLAGVRILHLYQDDFRLIDALIRRRIQEKEWVLFEIPVAHTWDPEATKFFADFDVKVEHRETRYTSVHYVVKPRLDSPICCEIQVRTLFEEIWGEVDHQINYPSKTDSIALREQLLVLSKITGAGSRLLDSIRRVSDAEND